MSAIAAAAGPWFQETTGNPWSVKQVFGYEVWHPIQHYQLAIDITESIQAKMDALACFKSQVNPTRYDAGQDHLSFSQYALCLINS